MKGRLVGEDEVLIQMEGSWPRSPGGVHGVLGGLAIFLIVTKLKGVL